MQYLKHHIPQEMDALVQYFDATYVSGNFCRAQHTHFDIHDNVVILHYKYKYMCLCVSPVSICPHSYLVV